MKTENGMENRTKGRKEKKIKNRADVTLYVSSHIRDKINSRARARALQVTCIGRTKKGGRERTIEEMERRRAATGDGKSRRVAEV